MTRLGLNPDQLAYRPIAQQCCITEPINVLCTEPSPSGLEFMGMNPRAGMISIVPSDVCQAQCWGIPTLVRGIGTGMHLTSVALLDVDKGAPVS